MMKLENIISWLITVEELAETTYSAASSYYEKVDAEFADFLRAMSNDEKSHYNILTEAKQIIVQNDDVILSEILIDKDTMERISAPILKMKSTLESGVPLIEKDILCQIISSEYSEWNDIFLYVLDKCQANYPRFQFLAAIIHEHEKRIQAFLAQAQVKYPALDLNCDLPPVWDETILVVDDMAPLRKIWDRVFSKQFKVSTAENGLEALEAVDRQFFNVIISDLNMPIMDGITFFNNALKNNPTIFNRFIFCTAYPHADITKLCTQYGIPLLQKPVSITDMIHAVHLICKREIR